MSFTCVCVSTFLGEDSQGKTNDLKEKIRDLESTNEEFERKIKHQEHTIGTLEGGWRNIAPNFNSLECPLVSLHLTLSSFFCLLLSVSVAIVNDY